MKIDSAKLKKSHTEPPADCAELIATLVGLNDDELLETLTNITTWTVGKCELYHWVSVLDKFDEILGKACSTVEGHTWYYRVDEDTKIRDLVLGILNFTALLIEYSCSRHIYNSIDHVISLMCVADLDVTHAVLNLLYTFTKRSTYLTRLNQDTRKRLISQLTYLADSWGGKENGYGLADCCSESDNRQKSATTLHFDFRIEEDHKNEQNQVESKIESIYIQNISKFSAPLGKIMEELLDMYSRLPKNLHMKLYTQLRLAHSFGNSADRLKCVQVRLHAISVLVFMSSSESAMSPVLYPGFVEEIVDLLQLDSTNDKKIIEIKAAALRTITSIVHLDHPPRLVTIIDATGSGEYHGLLPKLIRECIDSMTSKEAVDQSARFPHSLSTALFSFLYHLSSYESGAEALVNSGMVESLLAVIQKIGDQQDQIMFVTRAVRIVDLVTNVEMTSFSGLKGVQIRIFIDRLEREVASCRIEAPRELEPRKKSADGTMEIDENIQEFNKKGVQCMPQRSALFKSILNFLKKTIQDQTMAESIRHIMESSLPKSLRHIISNCDYYGASLFLVALEVIQFYVFHEPSLLSNMQETGITDVILQALLVKGPPATKEVLQFLPAIFTAMCMNEAGLNEFQSYNPFEKMFKVLINIDYLQAMKKRRSSESGTDTAGTLGSSVDELMRHQNSLRKPAIAAAIDLLHYLVDLGNDPNTIIVKSLASSSKDVPEEPAEAATVDQETISDEERVTMDEELPQISTDKSDENPRKKRRTEATEDKKKTPEKVPLLEYIVNVCKFLDSMLSNNNTPDHCKEFISAGGVQVLLKLVSLKSLPLDFPTSQAAQQVASVLRVVFVLSKDRSVLKASIDVVKEWLDKYEKYWEEQSSKTCIASPSMMLREYTDSTLDPSTASIEMPIFELTSKIFGFVNLLQNMTNNVQNEARAICVKVWSSDVGMKVMDGFAKLYRNLIWESSCMIEIMEDKMEIEGLGKADLDRIVITECPEDSKQIQSASTSSASSSATTPTEMNPLSGASPTTVLQDEVGSLNIGSESPSEQNRPLKRRSPEMQVEEQKNERLLKKDKTMKIRKMIRDVPYQAAQDLGVKLSTLFQLLVKFATAPIRNNRRNPAKVPPSVPARIIAAELTKHIMDTLVWKPPIQVSSTKFRLFFGRSATQLLTALLLDECKVPYMLMLQHLDVVDGLRKIEDALYSSIEDAAGIPLEQLLEQEALPRGVGEHLSEWLTLIEKLVDTRKYDSKPNDRSYVDMPDTYAPFHVPFKRASFMAHVHQIAFRAIKLLWGKKCLSSFGTKKESSRLLENILTVLRHIIKSEDFIDEALTVEKESGDINASNRNKMIQAFFVTESEADCKRHNTFSPRFSQIIQQLVAGENLQELLDEFMWLGPYEFIDKLFRNQDPEADLQDIHRAVDSMLGENEPRMMIPRRERNSRRNQTTSNSLRSSLASLSSNLERIAAELENPANQATDSDAQLASNVETLVSMGYSNELAGRALAQTRNNLTEAIEFCLTAPPLEEDDELAMAIRLSLGEPEESPAPAVPALELHPEEEEEPPVNLVEPSPPRELTPIDKLKKLNNENIARFAALLTCGDFMKSLERKESPYIDPADVRCFSENMTSGCFQMLEDDPKAVYSVSDLLIATMRRSDKSWTQHAITEIVSKIKITAKDVLEKQNRLQEVSKRLLTTLRDGGFDPGQLRKASQDLSTGLLLLTLLFDEAKMNCAKAIDSSNLMDTIVELLTMAKGLIDGAFEEVPKWVSSSLLLADLYQKISLADERQKQLNMIYAGQKVTWKYYEEREKRWKAYTEEENNKISKAFEKGESSCRVGGRRKYFICFNRMIQQSDENPNRKPIMRFFDKPIVIPDDNQKDESSKETPGLNSSLTHLSSMKLTDDQAKHLIECCVTLCTRRNTDSDTIHSSLRIVLRVTKKHAMALYFAEKGGLDMLFKLTHNQGFSGFYSIASLLIRHLLESPLILKACFRKTVSTFASASNAQQTLGVHDRSSSSRQSFREINLMLRQLSPVACRDPELFIEVVQKQLKINIRNYHGGKDISNVSVDTPRDAFINNKDNEKENMKKCPTAELSNILQILIDKIGKFSEIADKSMEDEPPQPTPLLSQSLLLRILAEIVGSYPACASALCKLKISGSESNLMEFIIDKLLLQKGETTPDNLCLNLLACFAACDHAKVKNLFIAELKNGLARIVKQPESSQKHHHLRAIVELVLVAIKRNSPPQKEDSLRSVVRSLPDKDINSLSITMVKRGVAQDLARTIHTLDLSSPHLSLTLNIIFRALETLSKVTGIAINTKSDANAKKSKSGGASTSASARSESPVLPSVQAARDLENRFPELMAAEREMRQQANEALMGIIAAEEQIQESRRRRQILIDAMPPPANPDRILEQDTDQGSNMEYEDEQSQEESIVAETDTEDLPELQDLYQAEANMHDDHEDDEEEDEDDDEGEDVDDDEDEDDDDEQGDGRNYTENDFLLPEGVGMDERPTDEIEEDMNRSDDEEEDDDDEESIEFPLPGEAGHYEGETYEILDPFNHRDMLPGIVPMDLMPRRGIERLMARDNLENFTDTFGQPWGRGREHVPFSRSFLRRRELRTRGASSTSNTQPPPADNSSRNLLQPLNPTHPLLSRVGAGSNSSAVPRANSSAVRDYVLQYSGRNWESYQSYPYYFHRHRLRPHNIYNSPASFFGRDLTRAAQSPNAFSSTQMNMSDLLPDHTCIVRTARYSQDERLNDTEVIFPSAFYRWAEAATVLDGESIHNVVLIVRNDIMPVLEERCKKDLEEAEKARKAKEEERKKAEAKKKKEEAEKKLKEEAEKKAKEEAEKAEAAKTEAEKTADDTEEGTSEPKSKEEPTTEPPPTPTGPNQNASFAEILNSTTDLANLDTSAGDIPQEFTEAIQAASQEAAASQNSIAITASADEIIASSQPVDIAPTTAVVPPARTINPWQEMDPAILNELPEEVRREVYASVLDTVRRETTTAVDSTTLDPIDDEFLNALPANIRREVTAAHERVTSDLSERAARVGAQAAAAQSTSGAGNSGDGNIEDWIRTLPQDLRRTILTDMAEENVAALPEDLQTEARNLQQRTLRGMNALESYRRRTIRPSNFTGRANYLGRYDNRRGPDSDTRTTEKKTIPHLSPKYMIDAESLSCILAVLFVNDNGIQQRKLHMILKNFAMHGSTCNWLINSLLDIIHRTTNTSSSSQETSYIVPNWLSLKLEASLGVRHSVFQIKNEQLEIHPQAASYICRSVLDSLTYLAKWNSKFFNATASQSTVPPFWDLLLKLEKNSSSSNFGKKADPQCQLHVSDNEVQVVKNLEQLNKSVFASLLRMLSHPVINESKSLLDKTLSLISIVAIDLPVITGDQGNILKDEISNLVSVLGRVSSEEGTQECTNILLEMSRCHISFRIQVLDELIAGASTLGKKLEEQLQQLSIQLKNRTKADQDDSKKNELTVPAMQKLTSKNSVQASFLRLLKIIEELRRSDFGASNGQARGLNWRENGQRAGRSRDGRGHSWLYRMRGMQMPGRFQFDETLNDVIHAAISRNRPDTAETIIDVMERQLSGRGGIQDVLLPRFMRDGASDRASTSRSGSASSQRASTSEADDKKDAESVKESDKLKKEAASLNDPLADLLNLSELWQILSESLGELDVNKDSQTFMVLQPAVEAFFMVHASASEKESEKKETKQEMLAHIEQIAPLPETHSDEKEDESSSEQNKFKNMPQNTIKFLQFAEKHKAVLNQILRQSSTPLVDGPFSVLTKHIRLLDFDIKRRYFRKELDKIKENTPRGDTAIHVNRETIFDDSFRELHRKKPEDWKGKLYIVFNNEEGQDAGGLLREWFLVISRQMFNPNYALFAQAANDRVTYRINPYSDVNPTDKLYFNFVGHVVAKAILDNKLLECYFTRAFYKHMLGVTVTYKDMEAEDLELYRSLLFLINNPVADLGYEITFSMDFERFGKTETIDLKENGRNIPVTNENKLEYVHLICQEKMVGSVKNQLRAFLEGFYDIIPRRLISIFDEHELELLISGLPTIDIDDLKANTEYQKYNAGSLQIQWFWRALKSFNQEERAKFLQFVTGTSKVPLRGFANLEGMNGTQKFQIHRDERSTSRLPCAHTCFNQLDLPVYETYEKLRTQMLKAITESSEGFGLA